VGFQNVGNRVGLRNNHFVARGGESLSFFERYFGELTDGENQVCCPFHNDTRPSAHVNTEKGLFHCKVCDLGISEAVFTKKLLNMGYKDALKFIDELGKNERTWEAEKNAFLYRDESVQAAKDLGVSDTVIEELELGYMQQGLFSIPVKVYGAIMDTRTIYPKGTTFPNGKPKKVISEEKTGNNILPFDRWIHDTRPTLLCAGEKDMMAARSNGFNAITFTHGEGSFPVLYASQFRDRKVYVVYDNDDAGRDGAIECAVRLKEAGAIPYVVTGHHSVCTEKGEDIHDFFMKYNGTANDLKAILTKAVPFSEEEYQKERTRLVPLVRLIEAVEGQYTNQYISSRVQTTATFDDIYKIPEFVEFEKITEHEGMLTKGDKRYWSLDSSNLDEVLYLMDSNIKKDEQLKNLKKLIYLGTEKGVTVRIKSQVEVFKAAVSDDLEKESEQTESPIDLVVYSIGKRLESGQKYRVTYKAIPHPLQAQKVVGIVSKVEESDNSVNAFKVNEGVLESMKVFQVQEGQTVEEKIEQIYQKAKGFAGAQLRKQIYLANEFFFHTPLHFQFFGEKTKAILDVMIIGEPRSGKSKTSKSMIDMYELGIITSLKTSTEAGLIGGSDKSNGGFKTKIGVIPRNHKGAVVLEEFSGAPERFISSMTEIRSSNKLRINRVNGTLVMDCMVRMLSISNPKVVGGYQKTLHDYPDGVEVLRDLIGANEDIARYDYFLLVDKPKGKELVNPKTRTQPAYDKQSYMNRIRWIWSRKPEQIVFEPHIEDYLISQADRLTEIFGDHLNIFGTEAWEKLARVSVATAATVCAFDETGEKLLINEEHINYAYEFLKSCYDNDLFRFKEYVDRENKYVTVDDLGIAHLQSVYDTNSVAITQLEQYSTISRAQFAGLSGLSNDDCNKLLSQLTTSAMIRHVGKGDIQPTQRFRRSMRQIEKHSVRLQKVGDVL
jgi:hypothetical protein